MCTANCAEAEIRSPKAETRPAATARERGEKAETRNPNQRKSSSAHFQSGASQGFQPAGHANKNGHRNIRCPADWKSAIRQIGNLRYFQGCLLGFEIWSSEFIQGFQPAGHANKNGHWNI